MTFTKKSFLCIPADIPPENSTIKIHVYSEDNVPVMRCAAHSENSEGITQMNLSR